MEHTAATCELAAMEPKVSSLRAAGRQLLDTGIPLGVGMQISNNVWTDMHSIHAGFDQLCT